MSSAYYLITADEKIIDRKAPGCIGKLRSNLAGTEYNIYGTGENPQSTHNPDDIRNLYGAILYDRKSYGVKGYRKMDVMIPQLANENEFCIWKPLTVIV